MLRGTSGIPAGSFMSRVRGAGCWHPPKLGTDVGTIMGSREESRFALTLKLNLRQSDLSVFVLPHTPRLVPTYRYSASTLLAERPPIPESNSAHKLKPHPLAGNPRHIHR